jgi:hypothetical protein
VTAIGKTPDEIWAGDHLGRREDADYLSGFLSARYQAKAGEAGFVLAINADWGMGKSFLLQRLSEQMQLKGHPIVKFDAWENDFTPEPLIAFIAELNEALGPQFKRMPLGDQLHADWYDKAKAVLVPGLKTVGFALAKHGLGIGAAQVKDLLGGGAESEEKDYKLGEDEKNEGKFDVKEVGEKLNKVVEETLKEHRDTKLAIKSFKSRLATLIEHLAKEADVQLPICVFVDELDRCRPNYAIQLLEGIKHLFGVPGLHFVIATNLAELAHSVRAVYGSGFTADRYLKRFFDMEYTLPTPDSNRFAVELMAPLAASVQDPIITGLESVLSPEDVATKGLPYLFHHYATAFALPLRDQQQVANILEAALLTLRGMPIHAHFLIFLAMLYQKSPVVYQNVGRTLNLSESTGFNKAFPNTGDGSFEVPQIRDGFQMRMTRERTIERIPPTSVAEIFFLFCKSNGRDDTSDWDNFPMNLNWSLSQLPDGKKTIRGYIDIVRRAGRFVK